MKKTILILSIVVLAVIPLNAKVWRLNNTGADADFTTLQSAHNSSDVLAGDTLHLEASSGSYGDLTATKPLVIIGAGYFLNQNDDMQANINHSIVGTVTFNAGSQSSIIEGCDFHQIIIGTSNIIIQRNVSICDRCEEGLSTIYFNEYANNIIIRNNYLYSYSSNRYNNYAEIICCYSSYVNNIVIINNYFESIHTDQYSLYMSGGFSGIIENNVIKGKVFVSNSVFNNNIMVSGNFSQSNCTYTHNIGNSTQFGTDNGNQQNINMADVFVGATGNSSDGQWQLKSGSPAIGAGTNGIDCGMFGGDFPYHLSGLPSIPAIYYHEQTIDNVNQQLNITIKAKSHN